MSQRGTGTSSAPLLHWNQNCLELDRGSETSSQAGGQPGLEELQPLPAIPRESGPNSSRTQLFLGDKPCTASQVGQPRTEPNLSSSREGLPVPPHHLGPPSRSSSTRNTRKRENAQHQGTVPKTKTSLNCRRHLTAAPAPPGTEGWSTWADPEPGPRPSRGAQLAPSLVFGGNRVRLSHHTARMDKQIKIIQGI